MARRGLRRIHVAQLTPHEPPPPGCVAGVNTHDTPTFAAGGGGRAELEAVLDGLARSPAWLVLATLEDLWLETRPQNVPGTGGAERPNWRGRMRVSLDELPARGDLIATLLHARRA
jgi:4-alpha-glucanotransferase